MTNLEHYLTLPYRIELIPDDGGITAVIPDLPGCMAFGETREEALQALDEVKEDWISGRLEDGLSVPEPRT